MKYAEYLQSEHWRQLRRRKVEAANYLCERCGEGARHRGDDWIGIEVHHRTYKRLGHERLDDLEALCIYCHRLEHGFTGADTDRIKIRTKLTAGVVEYSAYDNPDHPDYLLNV